MLETIIVSVLVSLLTTLIAVRHPRFRGDTGAVGPMGEPGRDLR